jgi:diguanylate cyclase (GGDEF)-like protein/PAS domain S-box-containing protein
LEAAFVVLIALLVGIGQLGLRRMHQINDTLSGITGVRSEKLQLAREVLTWSNRNSRITMEIFLVQDRALIRTLLAERAENTKKISGLAAKIASRCDSEDEKQRLSVVEGMRKPYIDSYLRAIHLLVDKGEHDAAVAVMVNETLPALLKYHAAWDEFVDFQKTQLDTAAWQARADYSKARRVGSLLFLLALAVGIGIAIFTTRHARQSDQRSEIQYQLLFDSNPLAMWVFERKTLRFLAVNEAASRQYGFSSREFLTMTIADIRSEEDLPALSEAIAKPIHAPQEATVWRHRKKNGAIIDVEIIGHDLYFHGIEAELVAARDISERKRSEEMLHNSENKYRVLFEDSADANWLMDEKGFLDCNSAALRMFGYSAGAEMMHPSDISPLKQPDGTSSRVAAEEKIAAAFRNGTERFEWLHQRQNNDVFPAEVCLTALTLSGQPRLLATVRDITDRKVAEERIQYLALYDALTGLPNRTLLQDRLAKALAAARRQEDKVALLFLDLDRFKDINDSLGHSVGDLLLQGVAERLKAWGREQDTVARLGGDEFLIMITHVKNTPDAAVAAERLMDAMTAEFVVQNRLLSIGCSVGISIFPEHGADSETLIKNADTAMYSAKDSGRNNFRFFSEDMNAQVVERLTVESSLRMALAKEQLFLMYQPQMDVITGKVTGLEALLRWNHPDLGLVPPDKFIRIAENSGLIVPIGEWVLRTACSQARKWQKEGLPPVAVAVNVSAIQFRQKNFCELISRVLHESNLAPQYLELELTESLLLSNADLMLSVVQELTAMGLTLAIDDFGTGYSSFAYLRQFRVGKIKIDRVFIRDVAVNPDDAAITTAIINMAKSLRLKVIAEGVENEAQLSFLRAHHCDAIQGYYFSKPLAVDKVADKLRGNPREPEAERKPAEDNHDNKPYEVQYADAMLNTESNSDGKSL